MEAMNVDQIPGERCELPVSDGMVEAFIKDSHYDFDGARCLLSSLALLRLELPPPLEFYHFMVGHHVELLRRWMMLIAAGYRVSELAIIYPALCGDSPDAPTQVLIFFDSERTGRTYRLGSGASGLVDLVEIRNEREQQRLTWRLDAGRWSWAQIYNELAPDAAALN